MGASSRHSVQQHILGAEGLPTLTLLIQTQQHVAFILKYIKGGMAKSSRVPAEEEETYNGRLLQLAQFRQGYSDDSTILSIPAGRRLLFLITGHG